MTDDDLARSLDGLTATLPGMTALAPEVLARGTRRRRAKLAAVSTAGVAVVVGGAALLLSGPLNGPDTKVRLAGPSPTTAPSTPTSPSPLPDPTSDPAVQLILEPDGLGYLAGPASIRHLTFADADRATVTSVVSQSLGEQPTTSPLPDCAPAVEVVQYKGFTLYFDGAKFVGWSEFAKRVRPPMTADGLGLGVTLQRLRDSLAQVVVSEGTVGVEWSTNGGLAGGLDGKAPSSTVTRIGAGQTCIFR